jgi:hypothetical protein
MIKKLTYPVPSYTEGIKILYSTNTFQFNADFISFRNFISPPCFESIVSLRLRWFYHSGVPISQPWECLNSLPNLRELRMSILASPPFPPFELGACFSHIDRLVCKQGPVLEKVRFVVPYFCFQHFDKRGEEVTFTTNGLEVRCKVRRVVSDGPSSQWSYWIESRIELWIR